MDCRQAIAGFVLFTVAWAGGSVFGKWAAEEAYVHTQKRELARLVERCDYTRHPISDMAWLYVYHGIIPPGTARYYSGLVTSDNGPAVLRCIEENFG